MINGIPRFLQTYEGEEVGRRPRLHVDELEGEGTALDTIRLRPGYKTRLIKKAKRKLQEAEEFRAFIEQKQDRRMSLDQLKDIMELNGDNGENKRSLSLL